MIGVTVFLSILNQMEFHLKSKGKLSPRSYPIQCDKKWKYSFFSVPYIYIPIYIECMTSLHLLWNKFKYIIQCIWFETSMNIYPLPYIYMYVYICTYIYISIYIEYMTSCISYDTNSNIQYNVFDSKPPWIYIPYPIYTCMCIYVHIYIFLYISNIWLPA